jgi:chaperonin GroEL
MLQEFIQQNMIRIPGGQLSYPGINNYEKEVITFNKPRILITSNFISSTRELVDTLLGVNENNEELILIAKGIYKDPFYTLVRNKERGTLKVILIQAPKNKDGKVRSGLLKKIAQVTNSFFFKQRTKLDKYPYFKLGKAEKVIITKNDTTIII